MTYYKYAEREANSQINWAEVSKGLTDTITQIDQDRQAKKAAIDDATRKDMLTLADAPKGENTTASEWTIKYANDMMNYRLTIDRLLKSGKMSLRDYQVAAQNSKDSTNLVFTISKEYQDQYKVIMDRAKTIGKNGMTQSSRLEPELAALNESLANISSTVPYINSTNGMVYLATGVPGEDGVQQMGDNYVSLQALRNRVSAKIDSYSLSDGLSNAASKLGEYTISELGKTDFRRTGVVTEISDPTLRKTFTDWENATVKEVMASEYRLASIMADNMNINPRTGNQYTATYNKKEFDADKSGDLILMENQNGSGVIMPQFKEEQRKDVEAFIKGQIRTYIDQKTEKRPFQEPEPQRPQQWEVEAASGRKTTREGGNMLAKLYSGDAAEIQSAVDHFNGLDEVDSVVRTPDGIDVKLSNGKEKSIKFKNPDGTLKTQADFIRSASNLLIGSDADVNEVLRGAISTGKKAFNTAGKASAVTKTATPATQLTPQQKAKNYLASSITADIINQEEEMAVPQLLSALGKLGFDAEESGYTGNYVTIKAPKKGDVAGASKEFSLKDGPEASAKVRQNIIDFVISNLGQDALLNADQAGVFGGTISSGNVR
jgi:hypothetical protein